jgi:hypothetical protein
MITYVRYELFLVAMMMTRGKFAPAYAEIIILILQTASTDISSHLETTQKHKTQMTLFLELSKILKFI